MTDLEIRHLANALLLNLARGWRTAYAAEPSITVNWQLLGAGTVPKPDEGPGTVLYRYLWYIVEPGRLELPHFAADIHEHEYSMALAGLTPEQVRAWRLCIHDWREPFALERKRYLPDAPPEACAAAERLVRGLERWFVPMSKVQVAELELWKHVGRC